MNREAQTSAKRRRGNRATIAALELEGARRLWRGENRGFRQGANRGRKEEKGGRRSQGGAGRDMTYTWAVSSQGNTASIEAVLAGRS